MKKRVLALAAVMTIGFSSMTVNAQPKLIENEIFDAEYYAKSNPDVVSVYGTDENSLFNHYKTCGKSEGRLGYEAGTEYSINIPNGGLPADAVWRAPFGYDKNGLEIVPDGFALSFDFDGNVNAIVNNTTWEQLNVPDFSYETKLKIAKFVGLISKNVAQTQTPAQPQVQTDSSPTGPGNDIDAAMDEIADHNNPNYGAGPLGDGGIAW